MRPKFCAPVPTSGANFREEKREKIGQSDFCLKYRYMLLFLDHSPYRRAHFIRDALRVSQALLAVNKTCILSYVAQMASFTIKLAYVKRLPLDPIYTGLVTMVQVLYLLEICCRG